MADLAGSVPGLARDLDPGPRDRWRPVGGRHARRRGRRVDRHDRHRPRVAAPRRGRGLLQRQPGVDVIALLAMGGSLALEEYLAGAVIALMLATGEALESYADRRAHRELSALLDRAPRTVSRYEDGALVERPVEDVRRGDRLLVKQGAVIPVDGVASTHAVLDESALTGESRPVERAAGDPIRSGAVNAGGAFDLIATTSAEDSTYAGIVRLVQEAERQQGPVRPARRSLRDRLRADHAGHRRRGAWAVSGDALRALSVLVVATPCPLAAGRADRDRVGDLTRRASGDHREGGRRPRDAGAREGPRSGQDRHAHVGRSSR